MHLRVPWEMEFQITLNNYTYRFLTVNGLNNVDYQCGSH